MSKDYFPIILITIIIIILEINKKKYFYTVSITELIFSLSMSSVPFNVEI
jgi:hypothetical protein